MYQGYEFRFKIGDEPSFTLPITPSEVTQKIGSNNKVITLINEGDVNILKSPSLVEFEFDARFPSRKYPFSREYLNFEEYYKKFLDLKTKKQSCLFSITRKTPTENGTWKSELRVAIEDLTVNENANEGDDVIVTFKLKEYKDYGIKKLDTSKYGATTQSSNYTSGGNRNTDGKATNAKTYTVKQGDCLWNIAKSELGNGAKYTLIYNANKEAIEADAKKHGKESSFHGQWIWAGLVLTIPAL